MFVVKRSLSVRNVNVVRCPQKPWCGGDRDPDNELSLWKSSMGNGVNGGQWCDDKNRPSQTSQ